MDTLARMMIRRLFNFFGQNQNSQGSKDSKRKLKE